MDGAMTASSHPRCKKKIGLPIRADLLLNGLSPDLELSKAREFYKLGYRYIDEEA